MSQQPESSVASVLPERVTGHPLATQTGSGYVITEAQELMVRLSAGLADLLRVAAVEGFRTVVVTPAASRLSVTLLEMLTVLRGGWVIQTEVGLRDGFTGRTVIDPGEVLRLSLIDSAAGEIEPPSIGVCAVLRAAVSVQHPDRGGLKLGGVTELLAERLGAGAAAG